MENITVENANEMLAKAKISDTNYTRQAAAWVIVNQFCYQSGLYNNREDDHLSGIQKVIKYLSETQSENKALRDWKESALAVFAEWDRVSDYIKPRCRLGDKYSARALELFKMIDAENKALREDINALNGDIQLYRNGHEVNAKRYNDLLIERNKLKEEISQLKAEVLKEKFPEN